MPRSLHTGLIIRGVGATSSRLRGVDARVSQGSSLLATLGFIAESLWDSRSLASIKVRKVQRQPRLEPAPVQPDRLPALRFERCSDHGRTPPPSLKLFAF